MKLRNVTLPTLALLTILTLVARVSSQTPAQQRSNPNPSFTIKPTSSHHPVASQQPRRLTNQPIAPSPSDDSHAHHAEHTEHRREPSTLSPTPIESPSTPTPHTSISAQISHDAPTDDVSIPDQPVVVHSDQQNRPTDPSHNAAHPTPSLPHARQTQLSPSPNAVDEEQVFVPLKEWKQKKLEDIESRIRNTETKQAMESAQLRRRNHSLGHTTRHTNSIAQKSGNRRLPFLIRPHNVCPLPSLIQNTSEIQNFTHSATNLDASQNVDPPVSDEVHRTDPVENHRRSDNAQAHASIDDESSNLPVAYDDAENTDGPPVAHSEHATVPDKYVEPHIDIVQPLVVGTQTDGIANVAQHRTIATISGSLTAELDASKLPESVVNSFGSRLNPIVGEIVKTIRDASNVLSSAPLGAVKHTLNKEATIVNRSVSPGGADAQVPFATSLIKNTTEKLSSSTSVKSKQPGDDKSDKDRKAEQQESARSDSKQISDVFEQSEFTRVKGKPFNFASADAGARILSVSNGVVGAKNVISGSIDKYMLAPCAGEGVGGSRWIDLELSEDVILQSFETANFEFYSSSARRVVVLGSNVYPPKVWNILGIYEFANVRTLQRFDLEKKGVTTRYLRVMYAGKQGNEFYCPISTIRVYGKNLLSDWKDALDPLSESKDAKLISGRTDASGHDAPSKSSVGLQTKQENGERQTDECAECCGVECDTADSDHGADGKGENSATCTEGSEGTCEDDGCQEGCAVMKASESSEVSVPDATTDGTSTDDTNETRLDGDARTGARSDARSTKDEEESADSDRDAEAISDDDRILLEAMRADALSAVSDNDNIFRKVTRMIRLLELNQSLTNQYIDTHLARFAVALSSARNEAGRAGEAALMSQTSVARLGAELERAIVRLERAALRRDILLCVLTILIAFVIGIHWVLWGAVTGGRLLGDRVTTDINDMVHPVVRDTIEERRAVGAQVSMASNGTDESRRSEKSDDGMEWTESFGRRRKKKGRERGRVGGGGSGGGGGRKVRSQSSTELLAASAAGRGRSRNAFQALYER